MLIATFLNILLATQVSFGSPVNYPIALAGNFGEPRPNHFHGGIDVKTDRVEGKPIFSIGDGYVSQVTVGLYGFGNAVYVCHPEGYTSVYCHLKKFTPQLTAIVRKHQYAQRSANGAFILKPTEMPVSKGQLIAVSGNSGSSQAPHLHLEIHDNKNWDMLDPLDFLSSHVEDKMPPQAHGFMAYPKAGEGVFNGSAQKTNYGFSSEHLTRSFTAWGKVGFGLWANDYMEATYNHYGIRKTELYVDGRKVYSSNVNRIPVSANMLVNSWGDYLHYLRSNVWYLKSFVEPGNNLSILSTDNNRGIVDFCEERDYHLTYVVSDFKGNSRSYSFVVTGEKRAIPACRNSHAMGLLKWNRSNIFQLPGCQLTVGRNMLATDISLSPRVTPQPSKLSSLYQMMPVSTPLLDYARISLRVQQQVKDPSKLYIVQHWGTDRYMGGEYHHGWVTGTIRDLGVSCELAYDDEAPIIKLTSADGWKRGTINLSVTDGKSGLARIEGHVDNKFVLFEEVAKTSTVRCLLQKSPVKRNGKIHTLTFKAIDNRRNSRTIQAKFVY